jgi:hypothetical protein
MAPANGGWMQDYKKSEFSSSTNAYKGNTNPYATDESLGMAKRQLAHNPLTAAQQFN